MTPGPYRLRPPTHRKSARWPRSSERFHGSGADPGGSINIPREKSKDPGKEERRKKVKKEK